MVVVVEVTVGVEAVTDEWHCRGLQIDVVAFLAYCRAMQSDFVIFCIDMSAVLLIDL